MEIITTKPNYKQQLSFESTLAQVNHNYTSTSIIYYRNKYSIISIRYGSYLSYRKFLSPILPHSFVTKP